MEQMKPKKKMYYLKDSDINLEKAADESQIDSADPMEDDGYVAHDASGLDENNTERPAPKDPHQWLSSASKLRKKGAPKGD